MADTNTTTATPYKHTVLNEIFNAAFWDANCGAYVAPVTLEEVEERFNRVIEGLAALYAIPTSGDDAVPRLRTEDVPAGTVQEQLSAFYTTDLEPAFITTLGTPITGKPRIAADQPAVRAAREGILEQLGATKVNSLPAGQPGSLKFSLNVPALERLIGGNSEMEVELRKSIVQEFAKRHLTSVAQEWKATIEAEKQRLFDEVFNNYCVRSSWGSRTLSSDASALVLSEVKNAISALLQNEIQKSVQAAFSALQPQLDGKIEAALHHVITTKVHEKVKQQALGALKEALG